MRWLCNENNPRALVEALIAAGHDAQWVRTTSPGATDEAVLACAARESRTLLTCDKDFGELAARSPSPPSSGIVLLRVALYPVDRTAPAIAMMLSARTDWADHFSVSEPARIRMRRLPRAEQPAP
jgi:predicted nuclease of predicted toxin-antitoxin system